jgi:3-deoxy-D-manno-octulosonic-acid transferase
MENFAALARELKLAGGAIEIRDEDELTEAVRRLLLDTPARNRLVENAQRVVDIHRGATKRTVDLVLAL